MGNYFQYFKGFFGVPPHLLELREEGLCTLVVGVTVEGCNLDTTEYWAKFDVMELRDL